MEKLVNGLDRFKLMHPRINKTIDYLLLALIIYLMINLLICFYSHLKATYDISTELIAVFGSLLGATVGGAITYFTTTHSVLKANHVKSSIINKKTIYEPLFKELKELLSDFKNLDSESIYYKYRWGNSGVFEAWTRIKSDTRLFQIPKYIRDELFKMEHDVKDFFEYTGELHETAFNYFVKLLEYKGYLIKENISGVASMFETIKILNKEKDIAINIMEEKVVGLPHNITIEDKQIINEQFNRYILNNDMISKLNSKKQYTITSLENCNKLIELIITTIIKKYERQNNIF